MSPWWRFERRLWAPSAFDAIHGGYLIDPVFFAPIRKRLRLPIDGYDRICTLVSPLLFACRPLDVARLVIPVDVNAVNRKSRPRITEVFEKVRKILPPFADRYSSSAIIRVTLVPRVVASLKHGVPDVEKSSFTHAMSAIEILRKELGCFVSQTTAGQGYAANQRARKNDRFISAFAKAQPARFTGWRAFNSVQNRQPTKNRA